MAALIFMRAVYKHLKGEHRFAAARTAQEQRSCGLAGRRAPVISSETLDARRRLPGAAIWV